MSIEDQLEIAAIAREKLETLHDTFMDAIRVLKAPKVNGAEFYCIDGELAATCLGVDLQAPHRLIARAGQLDALEYMFVAQYAGEVIPIWSMYLAPDRSLYVDVAQRDVLCDMTNQYFPRRVATHIASRLLASKVFAPRT